MAGHPEPPESDDDVRTDSSAPAETDRMREVDLDTVVRRRTPTRTRVIQVGVLLTALLVVGGLVFRGYQAAQPHPTTGVGDDVSKNVVIFSNVNHGTLSVNGTKLDVQPPVIVTLRPGPNTLTISAPPFRPHTCIVDMARQRIAGGQCGSSPLALPMDIGGKKAATQVEIPLTLADLPAEQQHRVAALVAQEIDGIVLHTTVPAHQYIATGVDAQGHITSRLADEELQANVAFVRHAGQAGPPDATCVESICAVVINPYGPCGVSDASGTAGTGWRVATSFVPQWRFTTPTGDTAALSPLNVAPETMIDVPLQYDAAHGWRPWGAPGFGNFCNARDIMVITQSSAGSSALSAYGPANFGSIGCNGIEGCDIQVLNSSGKPAGRFLWRFGVLLAADAAAHALIPSLPIAPQAEIDAVTK